MTSTVSLGAESSRVPIARTRIDQLLEVVEHEQEVMVTEVFDHRVGQVLTGRRSNAQSPGDLGGHERRITHRSEVDEEHAVGMTVEPFPGDLEREPGLARATGTRQREQAGAVQQAIDLHDLGRPADEGRSQRGQVRSPRIERAQRREAVSSPSIARSCRCSARSKSLRRWTPRSRNATPSGSESARSARVGSEITMNGAA